jgi:hypothetical protein
MKKVRYMVAAIGVAPALGTLVQGPVAAAATHTPTRTAKTVSLRHSKMVADSCVGTDFHSKSSAALRVGFYSTKNGSKTCVGSISAHAIGAPFNVSVWVEQAGKRYCYHSVMESNSLKYACDTSFTGSFSVVAGSYSSGFEAHHSTKYKVS